MGVDIEGIVSRQFSLAVGDYIYIQNGAEPRLAASTYLDDTNKATWILQIQAIEPDAALIQLNSAEQASSNLRLTKGKPAEIAIAGRSPSRVELVESVIRDASDLLNV